MEACYFELKCGKLTVYLAQYKCNIIIILLVYHYYIIIILLLYHYYSGYDVVYVSTMQLHKKSKHLKAR